MGDGSGLGMDHGAPDCIRRTRDLTRPDHADGQVDYTAWMGRWQWVLFSSLYSLGSMRCSMAS